MKAKLSSTNLAGCPIHVCFLCEEGEGGAVVGQHQWPVSFEEGPHLPRLKGLRGSGFGWTPIVALNLDHFIGLTGWPGSRASLS